MVTYKNSLQKPVNMDKGAIKIIPQMSLSLFLAQLASRVLSMLYKIRSTNKHNLARRIL